MISLAPSSSNNSVTLWSCEHISFWSKNLWRVRETPTPTHLPSSQYLNVREKTWYNGIVCPKNSNHNIPLELKTNSKDKHGPKISLFVCPNGSDLCKKVESILLGSCSVIFRLWCCFICLRREIGGPCWWKQNSLHECNSQYFFFPCD